MSCGVIPPLLTTHLNYLFGEGNNPLLVLVTHGRYLNKEAASQLQLHCSKLEEMSQILTPINYKFEEIKETEVCLFFNCPEVYQSMLPQNQTSYLRKTDFLRDVVLECIFDSLSRVQLTDGLL